MYLIRLSDSTWLPDATHYIFVGISVLSAFLRYRHQIVKTMRLAVGLTAFGIAFSGLFVPGFLSLVFGRFGLTRLETYFARKAQESTPAKCISLIMLENEKQKERKKDQIYHIGIF